MSHHPAPRRQPRGTFSRSIIACAIGQFTLTGAASSILTVAAPTSVYAQSETTQTRSYSIPAGPLDATLSRFGSEAGILLSFNPSTTAGLRSNGLSGNHTPASALNTLLAGTGLEAIRQGDGAYLLRKKATASPALSPEQPTTLEEVKVVAKADRTAETDGTGSYTTSAVTIGKGDIKSLREIPQSVSVITRQQMDDQAMSSVSDALTQTPGLYISSVSSELNVFQSRGYAMETSYDGISLSTGSSADFGRSVLDDLAFVDHVEVLRGAAGLLRGGNATPGFGGMVNIVRKKPKSEFMISSEVSAGSWNNFGGSVDVTGPLNAAGSVRGRAVIAGRDQDFFYDDGHQKKYSAYGVIEADLTPRTLLTLSGTYQDLDKTGFMGRVPRYSSDRSLTTTDRSVSYGADWARLSRRTSTISAELKHTFENDWKVRLAANYQKEKNDYLDLFVRGLVSASDTSNFEAYRYKKDVDTSGYDLSIGGPIEFWGRKHQFVIGVDQSKFLDGSHYGGLTYTGKNIYQPNISEPAWNLDYATYDFSQRSLYGSAQIKLRDNLTALLGARHLLNLKYISRDVSWDYSPYDLNVSNKTTPYGGIIWDIKNNISAYASYAEQFQPQSYTTASGSILPPIKGKQIEIGLKGEFLDKRLNASIAFYRLRQTNRPLDDPDNTGCAPSGYCYIASGLVQSQGIETEVSGSPFPGLQLVAGYTYNQNKYLEDDNASNIGQQFNGATPRHLLKLWGTYQFSGRDWGGALSGWKIGAGVVAQSSTYVSTLVRQGGYAVANAQIAYRFNPKTSIALNINNIFDKHYLQALSGTSYNYYGAPRNILLTFRHQF